MQLNSPLAKKRARIEIIPLIDIIFFLLATFVMVSLSMVKQKGIGVTLPEAKTGAADPGKEADITITITAENALFWNKEPITLPAVEGRFRQLQQTEPEARVSLNGDAGARLGEALALLDAARVAGLTRVQFQTRPASAPPSP